jgi:hypothetical protein
MDPAVIDLSRPLALRAAFRFPLQSSLARREVLQGALVLLIPGIGWILNMGHRIAMVHRMQHGLPPVPAWREYGSLFRHGFLALLGMVEYYAPALALGLLAWRAGNPLAWCGAAVLFAAATISIPGYMSHYSATLDAREIFNPVRALRRVFQSGPAYWRAWGIALCALVISFAGLLALGVGFLVTSVWFWQVAGFSFATVFTQRYGLKHAAP